MGVWHWGRQGQWVVQRPRPEDLNRVECEGQSRPSLGDDAASGGSMHFPLQLVTAYNNTMRFRKKSQAQVGLRLGRVRKNGGSRRHGSREADHQEFRRAACDDDLSVVANRIFKNGISINLHNRSISEIWLSEFNHFSYVCNRQLVMVRNQFQVVYIYVIPFAL